MNLWKINTRTKDIYDHANFSASVVSVISTLIAILYKPNKEPTKFTFFEWIEVIIIGCLILSPFIILVYREIRIRILIKKNDLSDYIIENRITTIDILDDQHAQYIEKIYFKKIGNNPRRPYRTSLNVDGEILTDTIRTINCSYSIDCENHHMKMFYVNNSASFNNIPNIYKKLDQYLIYSVMLKNSFLKNNEEWKLHASNLTQEFTIEIKLPPGKRGKFAKFTKENEGSDATIQPWRHVNIQPLLVRADDRDKIILQVMNFDKNEKFKLSWEYF